MNRSAGGAPAGAWLLAACNPASPSTLTEPRFGIEIRLTFWSRDHHRWVYRTVLAERAPLAEIVAHHGLRVG